MLLRWLLLASTTYLGWGQQCEEIKLKMRTGVFSRVTFYMNERGTSAPGGVPVFLAESYPYCYNVLCNKWVYLTSLSDNPPKRELEFPSDGRTWDWYKATSNQNTMTDVCFQDYYGVFELVFRHYEKNQAGVENYYDSTYGGCKYKPMKNCGISKCQEGQYASGYAPKNAFNMITTSVQCLPCQPGTFATCIKCDSETKNCECPWTIPENKDAAFISDNMISMNGKAPIGACFPCGYLRTVSYTGFHANDVVKSNRMTLFGEPTICPGNLNGNNGIPQKCPAGTESDSTYTACVCPKGTYQNLTNPLADCVDCQAGHYCTDGRLRVCPDHQYQDDTGQTACRDCVKPARAGANGKPVLSCEGSERVRQCVGDNPAYHRLFPVCTPCNACYRAFVNTGADKAPCYEA